MLPNFIGIGAPKAGTTWLAKCLAQHPQIFMAAVKETNFFDYHTIEGRLPEYETHFVGADGSKAIGEYSVRYLLSDRPPERIQRLIPNAKLLVSLRNPIDQIYSHYWHLHRQNFHEWDCSKAPGSFEEALEKYEQKLLGPALYHQHLRRWLKHFDRSQLLILFYDDICAQPRDVLKTVFTFLEVDDAFEAGALNEKDSSTRRGTSPRHPALDRIRKVVYDQTSRKIYYPLKRLMGVNRAVRLKDKLRVRQTLEFLFMRQGYPEMKPKTRALLRERFDQDIRQMSELAGRDLTHWR